MVSELDTNRDRSFLYTFKHDSKLVSAQRRINMCLHAIFYSLELLASSENSGTVQAPIHSFIGGISYLLSHPTTPNVPPLVQHPTLSITTYLSVSNWVDRSVAPRQYPASPRPTYSVLDDVARKAVMILI